MAAAPAPVAPNINFAAAPTPTYLGGNFAVSASTNSNGALTYSYVSGPCAQVSGGTFSSSGAGACTVQASTAATTTFLAGSATQVVNISRANQTITFNQPPVHYEGDPAFTVPATASSGLAVAFSATGNCTVAGNMVTVGTPGSCTLTASQAGNANFNPATSVARTFAVNAFTGFNLYAVSGSTTLPGQGAVPVLGYSLTNAAVSKPGGDPIVVNQGSPVSIRLVNTLTVPTSLLFQGQSMPPDLTGVAPGQSKVYTFTASQPGTYLYEAGLLAGSQYQVAMGLHGALIVRPTGAPLQAYAAAETAFTSATDEAVLVLSEIDTALNTSATPATFDMRNFAPQYFTINGVVYPNTAPIASAAGSKVLLRYVNAGAKHHSMALLGLRQNFVAKDGSLLPTLTHNVAAETLAPGQTGDAIVTVPATLAVATKFALYDSSLMLRNSNEAGFGGMLTFVTAGVGAGTTGPTTGAVTLSPNPANGSAAVTVGATLANGATAAEYFIDAPGASGTGAALGTPISTATLATLASGRHTVFVHATNGTAYGGFASATLNLDKTGPATSGLTLSPNPSNGTVAVAIHGSADDTATGGSNIVAAEYFVGTVGADGTGVAMNVSNIASPNAGLDATLAAPVTNAVISVHAQDALGNWGLPVTITPTIVATGPTTVIGSASPSPNNGALPFNSSVSAVRVTATINGTSANVALAEGFIDCNPDTAPLICPSGTGFQFVAADGAWNSTSEGTYGDIPLTTVAGLSSGTHTIYVHGKDVAGTWGLAVATTLVIDKTAPTLTATAAAGTVAFGTTVTINVNAADANGIAVREYWVDGTATPPANPIAFTGNSFNLSGLAAGTHTVYVRVQDGATNWSAVVAVPVIVIQAVNDTRTITSSTATPQTSDASGTSSVLSNDVPTTGVTGRTASLVSAPVRTSNGTGPGTGTIALSCPATLGTAGPAVGGNTICTNGAYRVTLTAVGTTNTARQASKRGTYTFTYTENLNGATSTATVTITVN